MAYKEIKQIVRNVKKKLKRDDNRPYRIRTKDGPVGKHGQEEYTFRTVDRMLTQPLGNTDFSRLSSGDKKKTWRFAAVLPPEFLKLDEQVEYKENWFEVKKINDWDSIMSAHMVQVS